MKHIKLTQGNRKRNSNSKTKIKGVTRVGNRWRVRLQLLGRRLHLGYYNTKVLAAAVYWDAARRFFGEFARAS